MKGRTPVVALLLAAALAPAWAVEPQRIGVVYDPAVDDHGFNMLFLQGVRLFESQRNVRLRQFDQPHEQIFTATALREVLGRAIDDGLQAIVFGGSATLDAVQNEVARQHPTIKLVAIDSVGAGPPNLQGVVFRFEEATYLAGIVAGRRSRNGVIGYVAGLDAAFMRSYGCAFAAGARRARPEVRVLARTVGNDSTAFSNLEGGRRQARALLAAGADVVFQAAGGSGLGVLAEVAEAGAFGIGVDANQNGLYPGRILTSVLKRLDVAVYSSLIALQEDRWHAGPRSVGLADGAVGLAMDAHNRDLIDESLRSELEDAEFAIVSGETVVPVLSADGQQCPDIESFSSSDRP